MIPWLLLTPHMLDKYSLFPLQKRRFFVRTSSLLWFLSATPSNVLFQNASDSTLAKSPLLPDLYNVISLGIMKSTLMCSTNVVSVPMLLQTQPNIPSNQSNPMSNRRIPTSSLQMPKNSTSNVYFLDVNGPSRTNMACQTTLELTSRNLKPSKI